MQLSYHSHSLVLQDSDLHTTIVRGHKQLNLPTEHLTSGLAPYVWWQKPTDSNKFTLVLMGDGVRAVEFAHRALDQQFRTSCSVATNCNKFTQFRLEMVWPIF